MPASDNHPYRPPTAAPAAATSSGFPTDLLKWLYATVVLTGALVRLSHLPDLTVARIAWLSFHLAWILGLVWLQRSWSAIPAQDLAQLGIDVSSGDAVWRFFLPVFNLYWAFAACTSATFAARSIARSSGC